MRKKRPFILLELFLALALVALFSLPLARAQALYLKKQKQALIELELERKAEEAFFKVCERLTDKHPLFDIKRGSKHLPFPLEIPILIDLGPLGKEKFDCHYHLHATTDPKKPVRKLVCQICFSGDSTEESCQATLCFDKMAYPFHLTTFIE